VQLAADHLLPGGMIILDNSDQCLKACETLRALGFTQIDFTGFIPGGGYAQATSIFFKCIFKFKNKKVPATRPKSSTAKRAMAELLDQWIRTCN
jgi:hypothetical protein